MITLNQKVYEDSKAILSNGKMVRLTQASFNRIYNLLEDNKLAIIKQTGTIYNLVTTLEKVEE